MFSPHPIRVKELSRISKISCGEDHFLALDMYGAVWAMGDDTFGQCGVGGDARRTVAPFAEQRFSLPQRVQLPRPAIDIASGRRHNLAITEDGRVYGWGYNHQQQLSHSAEFAHEAEPLHALHEPRELTHEIEGKDGLMVAAGEDFSVVVVRN